MFNKKIRPQPDPDLDKSNGPYDKELTWEASRIELIERSERKAWNVAKVMTALVVLSIAAIAFMMPLKESIPFLVRVDNVTGVPDIVTRMDEKTVTFDETMDKYWLARYVTARESYDWNIIQKDYDTVGLLSSPNVAAQYQQLFEGADSLEKRFGNRTKVEVKIVSVVPNGRGIGTVRFIKEARNVDDPVGASSSITKWVATVGYEYKSVSLLRESSRFINPMGFQVNTYRVDPETGVAP